MDIGKLKNNNQFAADWAETEVALILKEAPEFSLYIEEGYFWDIFEGFLFVKNKFTIL